MDTFDLYLLSAKQEGGTFSPNHSLGVWNFLKECMGVKPDFKLEIISNQRG